VGEQPQLVIEAEDNLQEFLIADTTNGVLEIKKFPENIQLNSTQPIRFFLTVKALESLTLKNSGDAVVTEIDTEHLQVRISGSGSIHIGALNATQLDINLTSLGNLIIDAGEVETQNLVLSSSGEYDGTNLVSQNTRVRLSSSGDANINVHENLEADLSSSGNVYYIGDPAVFVSDSSSTGKVIKQP
jgi:hypothetical protein